MKALNNFNLIQTSLFLSLALSLEVLCRGNNEELEDRREINATKMFFFPV